MRCDADSTLAAIRQDGLQPEFFQVWWPGFFQLAAKLAYTLHAFLVRVWNGGQMVAVPRKTGAPWRWTQLLTKSCEAGVLFLCSLAHGGVVAVTFRPTVLRLSVGSDESRSKEFGCIFTDISSAFRTAHVAVATGAVAQNQEVSPRLFGVTSEHG